MLIDSGIYSDPLSDMLALMRHLLENIGEIKVAKMVLLQQEALEHSKDIAQEGFTPIIVHDDLDIQFALEAMELIYNEKIETLALATENEKFLPLFSRAREIGKEVILLHSSNQVNSGLQNAADIALQMSI